MEAGLGTVPLVTGDGTLAVTFDTVFDEVPSVVCSVQDDDMELTDKYVLCNAASVTTVGFTIEFESTSAESFMNIAWIAMERRSSQKAAQ